MGKELIKIYKYIDNEQVEKLEYNLKFLTLAELQDIYNYSNTVAPNGEIIDCILSEIEKRNKIFNDDYNNDDDYIFYE